MKSKEAKVLKRMVKAAGYSTPYEPEKISYGKWRLLVEHPVTLKSDYFYDIQEFEESAEELLGKIDKNGPRLD